MQWPSVFLVFIISSNSFTFGMNNKFLLRNYVSPNKTAQCSGTGFPCLILQEYASQPDAYFINNTIVYFESGSHQLNSSLKLTNVHNFTFQGLPGDVDANVLLYHTMPCVLVLVLSWQCAAMIINSSLKPFNLIQYIP